MKQRSPVAIVTGAGRGLGETYARALSAAGFAVVVNDLDDDVAQAAVDAIVSSGGQAIAVAGSVDSEETAQALVQQGLDVWGGVDVLVSNAGVLRDQSFHKSTLDAFDLVVRTHLYGTYLTCRAAFAHFRENGGGRLILVGSPAGQRANFGQTAYSAAKAGIVGMARTWALEGAGRGILVNAIIPTALTRMTSTIPALADAVAAVERGEPVPADLRAQGMGTPEDVAALVVFLATEASGAITGQCLGMGGDRLSIWTQPEESFVALQEGGWTPEAIGELAGTVLQDRFRHFSSAPVSAGHHGGAL